jgi:hypothetical protein
MLTIPPFTYKPSLRMEGQIYVYLTRCQKNEGVFIYLFTACSITYSNTTCLNDHRKHCLYLV